VYNAPKAGHGQGENLKQKIRLTEERETLLVPLFSKAAQSQGPRPILVDPKAEEILEHIEYDFEDQGIPKQTLITLAMRAKKLDSYVRDYLHRSDGPVVLHLGCGLDSRGLPQRFGCAVPDRPKNDRAIGPGCCQDHSIG
jgi:O-methyltransferase involved in polyketide biosynthesis